MLKTSTLIKDVGIDELNALWAVLKYQGKIGILKKLKAMEWILRDDSGTLVAESPKDENGRILDKATRAELHEYLIKRSRELNQEYFGN